MQRLSGVLLFLIFICFVHLCIGDTDREMVVVFKGDKTEVPFTENNGTITMRKPRAFRVPAFVGRVFDNKEFLAVICDARYNGFSDWSFIELAAKTSYGDYKDWSAAKIIAQNTRRSSTHSIVGDATAVMKENKIYVLAPSWDASPHSWSKHVSNAGWNPLMIVGTVSKNTESVHGAMSVKWEKGKSLKSLLPYNMLGADVFQFIGGVGNGMVTKNGTIVFPINMVSTLRQGASSVIYSNDGEKWILGETTPQGPSECSVVEFNGGKWILNTRHNTIGARAVYESHDMGKNWKENLMFSRVWGNAPNRQGVGSQGSVITAPVDGEDVLLFAHPQNKKGGFNRDTLQLWLSDGKRIMCVGTISEDGKGERSGYSMLAHVGQNLYITHEINPFGDWNNYDAELNEWDRVIAISPLMHVFESIKKTVRAWRDLDTEAQTQGIPTDALVGFLGNNINGNVWEDMYNCVNATVKGGQRVDGGFSFENLPESGALWPVMSQGQNQVYKFTMYQFTLAATVTIHAANNDKYVPLIGAISIAQGNHVVLGIGCTNDNKWYVLHYTNPKTPTEVSFVPEKEYHIALTFAKGAASVYVNGEDITKGTLKIRNIALIRHFFLGGTGETFSSRTGNLCTVKNVLLFNRALEQKEIDGLATLSNDDKIDETTLTEKPTNAPENHISVRTTEFNARSVTLPPKVTKGEEKDNVMNKALSENRDAPLKKDMKVDNGAMLLFSGVFWMYFVCHFILQTAF